MKFNKHSKKKVTNQKELLLLKLQLGKMVNNEDNRAEYFKLKKYEKQFWKYCQNLLKYMQTDV